MVTPGVSKSDNDDVCSTSDGCTSRQRSTWPRLHPAYTVDVVDAGDRLTPSRHYRDVDCSVQQQQQQPASNGGCAGRQSVGVPRRHEWVTCVQRQRSAAASTITASTTSAHAQRPSTSISAVPPVLRRQKTVSSADATAVDSALSEAVNSPSPAATTTGEATSDDDFEAGNVLNYETVLRCLDSCDKILLRHSTVIT